MSDKDKKSAVSGAGEILSAIEEKAALAQAQAAALEAEIEAEKAFQAQRSTPESSFRIFMLALAVFTLITAIVLGFVFFSDPKTPTVQDANAPLVELPVPPLIAGEMVDGVRVFDLVAGYSTNEFFDGVETETMSMNGAPVLGPTLEWVKGDLVQINIKNELDEATSVHWHGGNVPGAADGGPHNEFFPGNTWNPQFPVIQQAATLWYHPHRVNHTARHAYMGLAGGIIVRDDSPLDETLPDTYGVDDFPIVLQDRNFDADGQMEFILNPADEGRLMDTLTVNGAINPYLEVPSGLVRLRFVNASQSRFYDLSVLGSDFVKIASDGGYLNEPLRLDTARLDPGSRHEIIVEVGSDDVTILDKNMGRVLLLRPNGQVSADTSIPERLNNIVRYSDADIDVTREFSLDKMGANWGINDKIFNMHRNDVIIKFGDTEKWVVSATQGEHSFHIHQVQFQVLSVNGEPPPPELMGWEDTVWVNEERTVEIAARFDSYSNPDDPYMFHCHLLDHEDLGMMGQFIVVR